MPWAATSAANHDQAEPSRSHDVEVGVVPPEPLDADGGDHEEHAPERNTGEPARGEPPPDQQVQGAAGQTDEEPGEDGEADRASHGAPRRHCCGDALLHL